MTMTWSQTVWRCIVAFGATISLAGCAHRIPKQYAGCWLLRTSNSNLMLLTTEVHGAHLRGEITSPKHFTEQADGSFIDVTSPVVTRQVAGKRSRKTIAAQIGDSGDGDSVTMMLVDSNHLSVDNFHGIVPVWSFERVKSGEGTTVKTDWPAANMDPRVVSFRDRLQAEADKDKAARKKEHLDDAEMAQLAAEALPLVNEIFETYGWPTVTVFGAQAAANYWLLVQHQEVDTQKRMIGSLQEAMTAGEASKMNYAYLFDRIQVSEGKPQHWGTQSRCEQGHAVLYPLDAGTNEVDGRRKAVGLAALNGTESENLCQHSNR